MVSVTSMTTEIKARIGNRTDLDQRIIRWLNYAYFELLLNPRIDIFALDKDTTITTDSTSNRHDLSQSITDLWFILSVRNLLTKRKIYRMHWSQADKLSYNAEDLGLIIGNTQHGEPLRYYRYGSELFFDPAPDGLYGIQIRYRRRPDDLVVGSTFPYDMGSEWEERLITLGTLKGFEALRMTDEAAKQRTLYEQLLRSVDSPQDLEDLDVEHTLEVSITPRT